jgi:hypothetical protein
MIGNRQILTKNPLQLGSQLWLSNISQARLAPAECLSVGTLEAKTGPHRAASTTVAASGGATDSGLVFAGSVGASACVYRQGNHHSGKQ